MPVKTSVFEILKESELEWNRRIKSNFFTELNKEMHEKKTLAFALVDRFEQEFACRRLWFSNDASLTPQKLQFSFFSNLLLRISLHQILAFKKLRT